MKVAVVGSGVSGISATWVRSLEEYTCLGSGGIYIYLTASE